MHKNFPYYIHTVFSSSGELCVKKGAGVREPQVWKAPSCLIRTWQMVWSAYRLPVRWWWRQQQISSERHYLPLLGGQQLSCSSSQLTEGWNEFWKAEGFTSSSPLSHKRQSLRIWNYCKNMIHAVSTVYKSEHRGGGGVLQPTLSDLPPPCTWWLSLSDVINMILFLLLLLLGADHTNYWQNCAS